MADFDQRALPSYVRAELRGLPKDLAAIVMGHLVAAGELIDDDPQLAYRHAEAARRRASRLPVVREATAETAYAAGEFAVALNEYRALRRMSGNDEYLAVMADCERALGRPEAALRLVREATTARVSPAQSVELVMVEAGAREDLGQVEEARRLLRGAIASKLGGKLGQARLHYAYAERLEQAGDADGALQWFTSAASLDSDRTLDAEDRIAALEGWVLEPDFEEDEGEVLADGGEEAGMTSDQQSVDPPEAAPDLLASSDADHGDVSDSDESGDLVDAERDSDFADWHDDRPGADKDEADES